LIDDYVLQFCKMVSIKDLITKIETISNDKRAKREYLNDSKTREFTKGLNKYFEHVISIPRIRMGDRQSFETLINEECYLFAKHLRNEKADWNPRIPLLQSPLSATPVRFPP